MKVLSSGSMSLLRGSIWSIPRLPLHQQCRTLAHSASPPLPSTSSTSSTSASTTTNLSLSNQVRLLMRRVPYPVAIITATDPTASLSLSRSSSKTNPNPNNPKDKLQLPHAHAARGMTVSSFNTVTLTPAPVVSFNVKRPSETLSALRTSRRFLAHLLAPNRDTAALARDFSRGNQNLGVLDARGVFGFEFVPSAESKSGSESGTGDLGLPMLRRRDQAQRSGRGHGVSEGGEGDDFSFILECRVHDQQVDVYDHTIVFGTVVRALVGDSPGRFDGTPGEVSDLCLTYADTRFWKMGREV